jgi:hypothetical protein
MTKHKSALSNLVEAARMLPDRPDVLYWHPDVNGGRKFRVVSISRTNTETLEAGTLVLDSGVNVDLALWESPNFQRGLSIVSVPLVVAEATERTMQQDLAKALDVDKWASSLSWDELLDWARSTLAGHRQMDQRLGRTGKEPF